MPARSTARAFGRIVRATAAAALAVGAVAGARAGTAHAAPLAPAAPATPAAAAPAVALHGKVGRMIPHLATRATPVHVALYGDSLAFEAQDHFVAAVTAGQRAEVRTRTYGGTAICDWFGDMRRDAEEWAPQAVVVEFSGNALTPCMRDADGAALSGDAYFQKYHDDAATVLEIFAGAEVWFAGSPISRHAAESGDFNGGRLNEMYRALPGGRYVDAGAAVLDRDGRYTETLPCLPGEPCGDDGTDVVRAPDGAHFCPANPDAVRGVTQGCAVWSSGAWRFGRAMALPVIADLGL